MPTSLSLKSIYSTSEATEDDKPFELAIAQQACKRIDMISISLESCSSQGICIHKIQVDKQLSYSFELPNLANRVDCLRKAADIIELNEWIDYVQLTDAKGG